MNDQKLEKLLGQTPACLQPKPSAKMLQGVHRTHLRAGLFQTCGAHNDDQPEAGKMLNIKT